MTSYALLSFYSLFYVSLIIGLPYIVPKNSFFLSNIYFTQKRLFFSFFLVLFFHSGLFYFILFYFASFSFIPFSYLIFYPLNKVISNTKSAICVRKGPPNTNILFLVTLFSLSCFTQLSIIPSD